MVHERDEKYDSQEDGEYHFSDDQANYEVEMDEVDHTTVSKPVSAAAAPAGARRGLEQYKRPIIGVVVFTLLVFIVYKITAPTPTAAPGDFSQNASATPTQKMSAAKPVTAANTAAKTTTSFQPLAQPLAMSGITPAGVSASQPKAVAVPTAAPVAVSLPAAAPTPVATAPVAVPAPALIPTAASLAPAVTASVAASSPAPVAAEQPAPAVIVQPEPLYNPVHPVVESNSMSGEVAQITALNQKVTNLTQENARIQAEYSQKMTDLETENTTLQNKLQDLNAHLASLETTMAHLGRAVQQETHPSGSSTLHNRTAAGLMPSPAQVMTSSGEPKSVYTVQAIIPGRAWLKSENGETVTVAEGDTLRGYGRIVKIDPYDGVVELDIGGRVVSLSYGATSE